MNNYRCSYMVIDHIIDGFVYKVIIVTRGIFFFILLSVVVNISFFSNYTRSTGTSFKNSVGAPTLTARSNAGEATWVVPECAY